MFIYKLFKKYMCIHGVSGTDLLELITLACRLQLSLLKFLLFLAERGFKSIIKLIVANYILVTFK